ncbi:MAG: hypothetical protein ACKO37_07060 [Vampirovibrionales bacterium]
MCSSVYTSQHQHPPWYQVVFPYQAVPFLLFYVILTPLLLLTGENLLAPLLLLVPKLATMAPEQLAQGQWMLPADYWVKLVTFLALSVVVYGLILLRVQVIYLTQWSRQLERPHEKHVDYVPHEQASLQTLIHWYYERFWGLVGSQVLIWGLLLVVILGGMMVFNVFAGTAGVLQTFSFILIAFLVLGLGLLALWRSAMSLLIWRRSVFGAVIAVTEPYLSYPFIAKRSARLQYYGLRSVGLQGLLGLLGLFHLSSVVWLLWWVDIGQLIQGQVSMIAIYGLTCLNGGLWLLGLYTRLMVYHSALRKFYTTLPQAVLDDFPTPKARLLLDPLSVKAL